VLVRERTAAGAAERNRSARSLLAARSRPRAASSSSRTTGLPRPADWTAARVETDSTATEAPKPRRYAGSRCPDVGAPRRTDTAPSFCRHDRRTKSLLHQASGFGRGGRRQRPVRTQRIPGYPPGHDREAPDWAPFPLLSSAQARAPRRHARGQARPSSTQPQLHEMLNSDQAALRASYATLAISRTITATSLQASRRPQPAGSSRTPPAGSSRTPIAFTQLSSSPATCPLRDELRSDQASRPRRRRFSARHACVRFRQPARAVRPRQTDPAGRSGRRLSAIWAASTASVLSLLLRLRERQRRALGARGLPTISRCRDDHDPEAGSSTKLTVPIRRNQQRSVSVPGASLVRREVACWLTGVCPSVRCMVSCHDRLPRATKTP
jgi:hypothetical protein